MYRWKRQKIWKGYQLCVYVFMYMHVHTCVYRHPYSNYKYFLYLIKMLHSPILLPNSEKSCLSFTADNSREVIWGNKNSFRPKVKGLVLVLMFNCVTLSNSYSLTLHVIFPICQMRCIIFVPSASHSCYEQSTFYTV